METLYDAPQYMFSREPKYGQFQQAASVLSSPSARSSSSSDSQEDLLPELWLESSQTSNYSLQTPGFYAQNSYTSGPVASANPRAFRSFENQQTQQNQLFSSNFLVENVPFFGETVSLQGSFNSSPLLRDESLEYAQSLLPNSLLFPNCDGSKNHMVEKQQYEVSTPSNTEPHFHETKPSSKRRDSWTNASKSRHGSASSSSSASSRSSVSSQSSKNSSKNASVNTQLYKTELCASFMKSHSCPYGGKCQFAHGHAELKVVERPSNWRSKACANWLKTGSCRYGKRCCFKHGE